MSVYLGEKLISSGGAKADMLNNPFTLLESKYSEVEITNASWLKSQGQWNSKALYPSVWEKLTSEIKTDTRRISTTKVYETSTSSGIPVFFDDGGKTIPEKSNGLYTDIDYTKTYTLYLYKKDTSTNYYTYREAGTIKFKAPGSGSDVPTIDKAVIDGVTYGYVGVASMPYNTTITTLISPKTKDSLYDDYDFVVDYENETFRLPLKTKTSFVIDEGEENGVKYRIWNDGYCEQWGSEDSGTGTKTITFVKTMLTTDYKVDIAPYSDTGVSNNIAYNNPTTTSIKIFKPNTACRWSIGGYLADDQYTPYNLYFYVGDTVKNSTLIDVAQVTSDLARKVDINSKVVDGQWVGNRQVILNEVTISGETSVDLSSIIPNDNYKYELLLGVVGSTDTTSGHYYQLTATTSEIENMLISSIKTRSSSNMTDGGSFIIPIGTNRIIKFIKGGTSNILSCYIILNAYRRIGTNE